MHRWFRRLGVGVAAVASLLVVAGAGVYGLTGMRMARSYDIPVEPVPIPGDSAGIARGRHVAVAIAKCVDCHAEDLGGKVVMDDPAFARLSASNLTRGEGGIGAAYTEPDLIRAIRHGVRPDGTPLLFMPAHEYSHLADADLGALIAYVRRLPPVDRALPASEIGPVARVLYAMGRLKELLPVELVDHDRSRPEPAPPGPTAAYGAYLAMVAGCKGCHGMGLSGGRVPGTSSDHPAATNLTPAGLGTWTEEEFFAAMREGRRPDGSAIDPRMPWPYTARMRDDEIRALWLYLATVPPRATGRR